MKKIFKVQLLGIFMSLSMSAASASSDIYYTDKNITIYSDGKIVFTGKDYGPTFSPAKNWVEEDFFTQQEKYCERDSIFVEKSKKF
jgi:hypothetical protein